MQIKYCAKKLILRIEIIYWETLNYYCRRWCEPGWESLHAVDMLFWKFLDFFAVLFVWKWGINLEWKSVHNKYQRRLHAIVTGMSPDELPLLGRGRYDFALENVPLNMPRTESPGLVNLQLMRFLTIALFWSRLCTEWLPVVELSAEWRMYNPNPNCIEVRF